MKKTVSLITLALCACTMRAQENFGPIPSASGSSGSSSVVQNNLFDGSANISVPFFSKQVDGVNISVNASYNTKGIKVDQLASSIGLGWELNTGGYIKRIARGEPDDLFIPEHNCTQVVSGPTSNYTIDEVTGSWINYSSSKFDMDKELDEFLLNLNGEVVKFVIARNGAPMIIPANTGISVERYYGGSPVSGTINVSTPSSLSSLQFRVTDKDGNVYWFKGGDYRVREVDNSGPIVNQFGANATLTCPTISVYEIDKWVLYRIETNQKNEIFFSYQTFVTDNFPLKKNVVVYEGVIDGMHEAQMHTKELKFEVGITAISQIYFVSDQTYVSFWYTNDRCDVPNTKALEKIEISQSTNSGYEKRLKYKFNYAYFHSIANGRNFTEAPFPNSCSGFSANGTSYTISDPIEFSKELRLKLLSIDIIGEGNAQPKQYYSFEYIDDNYTFNGTNYTMNMPPRLSHKQDYFGFPSEGQPTFHPDHQGVIIDVPVHTQTGLSNVTYGVNKEPHSILRQTYLIKKVKNGMGGESELFYLPYDPPVLQQSIPTPTSHIGGNSEAGNFISKQIDRDGYNFANTITTEFNYGPFQNVTSYRFIPGGTYSYGYSFCIKDPNTSAEQTVNATAFFNSFLSANLVLNGSNHGFTKVAVVKKNYNNDLISTTNYTFSNVKGNSSGYGIPSDNIFTASNFSDPENNNTDFNLPYHVPPYTYKQYFRDWAVGLPLEVEFLDYNNSVIGKTKYIYSVNDFPQTVAGDNWKCVKEMVKYADCHGNEQTYADRYYPVTGYAKLVKKVEEQHFSSNEVNYNTTEYEYLYDAYLRKVKSYSSASSDIIEKMYYYPGDWTLPTSIATYLLNNDIHIPLSVETWKTSGGNKLLIGAEHTGFNIEGLTARPKSLYRLESGNGLTTSSYTSAPQAFTLNTTASGGTINHFPRTMYNTRFDSKGRSIESIDEDGKYTVKLYSEITNHLLATIIDAKYEEVAYTSFEHAYDNNTLEYYKGRWDFDESNIKDYTVLHPNTPDVSGKYVYLINSGSDISTTINSETGKNYILTFWTKYDDPSIEYSDNNQSFQPTLKYVESIRNGWMQQYAEIVGTGNPITVTINGGSVYTLIDEVRLYPENAFMETNTYEPLYGISSTCDYNNNFNYYEYDDFGRQKIIRNQYNEILSKKEFVQQGND